MATHLPLKLVHQARQALRAMPSADCLPARELEIVKRRASGATFQEIADEMGVTRERIGQLHPLAMKRARSLIKDTPAEVYIYERFG